MTDWLQRRHNDGGRRRDATVKFCNVFNTGIDQSHSEDEVCDGQGYKVSQATSDRLQITRPKKKKLRLPICIMFVEDGHPSVCLCSGSRLRPGPVIYYYLGWQATSGPYEMTYP